MSNYWRVWIDEIAEKRGISSDEALELVIGAGVHVLYTTSPTTTGRPRATTTEQEARIYRLWSKRVYEQTELAEMYGLSVRAIGRIIRRWRPVKS